ncbi:MAG: class I mannose-6-phosphate isomerase [Lachnospiraceae bacterium]|nr:class I mannose-6-phosphate isomerase [Lachnospiraceae bacterium]
MNSKNRPFLLRPIGKDYLWGGERLNTDFHKKIALSPLAETWECSTHPDGLSTIGSGEHIGRTLRDVLREHPEYYGKHILPEGELPILVKLIDAKADLSVQVHPDDTYAYIHENGAHGKSEMWYVLDAAPDTRIIYGFTHDISRETLKRSLQEGTVEKYLQKVPVQKDDVFYIEAGTVHALGAGALVAEIQENSNLTYRLYDYNRVGKDGKKRQLHLEKALAVANLKSSVEPRQPMRLLRYRKGCALEQLCRCKYFQVERLLLNTSLYGEAAPYPSTDESYQVLLCVEGEGKLQFEQDAIPFQAGDCIFLPAHSTALSLTGKAHLLRVSC